MSKLVILISIISFWVVFPMFIMFMEGDSYDSEFKIVVKEGELREATPLTFIQSIMESFGTFFQILIVGIPNAHKYINLFVRILQIISLLTIIMIIRGGGD